VPEWGTADQIFDMFGLSRSTLIKLAASGRIKCAQLRVSPEARKSVRLFGIQSIRQLLEESVS